MNYEFITPSDEITFKAENHKVAFFVALQLGDGKAGCTSEKGESIPSMLMFNPDPMKAITDYIGEDPKQWYKENKELCKQAYLSFAYISLSQRDTYDAAIENLPADKLAEFKIKHEDKHRTSMSKWVAYAWRLGGFDIKTPAKIEG